MAKRSTAPVDSGLVVKVARGKLVIEIGVYTVAHSASYADWANPYDEESGDYIRTFAIADPEQFANDVAHEMQREAEDGSTPLSHFIDKVMLGAIEDGSLGIAEEAQRIKHGSFSPLETWAKRTDKH